MSEENEKVEISQSSAQNTKQEKKPAQKFPYRTSQQCRPWYFFIYPFIWLIFRSVYGLKVFHRERLPEGSCIVCPRHVGNADPPMVAFAMKKKAYPRVMAKQELLEIPFIGWILYKIGVFGVNRGANDMASIKNGLRALKEGSKLLIFPEGTRVKEGETPKAQTGAIMFALKAGVPLVPVYLTRTNKFETMKIIFGEPYMPQIAGKRATAEEYRMLADELLAKIYALESELE
ncbi:MAG: 1-acyl-sn-glycerol-3-phosphate acyltransferase [Oscillospiraceae bacterium]|nr:1-acyl-sn-glycerol-3-phosphate acyltransferase [Oscillospiraceae bacterium]